MLIQPVAKLTCIAIGLFFEGALQGIVFQSIAISNLPVLILLLVSRSRSAERNGVLYTGTNRERQARASRLVFLQ
jgi:hypothetical protein